MMSAFCLSRILLALFILIPGTFTNPARPFIVESAYATLTQVYDSLGNETTLSWTDDRNSGWSCAPNCPDLSLNVGETITITAEASDPNDRPLEYQFRLSSISNRVIQPWSSNSTFTWNITERDYGKQVIVFVSVRNDDGLNYQGDSSGDDYTYAIYQVSDPNHPPAYLTSTTDSLGNTNTNSWGTTNTGEWSCNPNCSRLTLKPGEDIALTANAVDSLSLPLEYKFSVQTEKSGSFITLRDWSPDYTYHWSITPDLAGQHVVVSIAVRNDDGLYYLNSVDDYTYAIYEIAPPELSNPTLTRLSDSLGNWTSTTEANPFNSSCEPGCPGKALIVGQSIQFTAEASDPSGLPLEYRFMIQRTGMSFEIIQDWSPSKYFTWNVTPQYYGQYNFIRVDVRNNDGYTSHFDYDDSAMMIYAVDNTDTNYATLLSVKDRFGNMSTFSKNKGSDGWSCGDTCPHIRLMSSDITPSFHQVVLNISIQGQSPDGKIIETVCWLKSPEGELLWHGGGSYCEAAIPEAWVQKEFEVIVGVKNFDGLDRWGQFGDDYVTLKYKPPVKISLPFLVRW